MVKLNYVTEEYLKELSDNAPLEQVLEVKASHGLDILTAAREGALRSEESWVALHQDNVIGVFGVIPVTLLGDVASPWLLTTGRYPKELLRGTKIIIPHLLNKWPILINYIDARYEASLRWAKWTGFTIHPAEPYGREQLPFHRIEMRKHGC